MPALNFKTQFADAVESGEKRQTIRAYRKDGRDPKPGDRLVLYTGMRTKGCRKLGEATCTLAIPFNLTIRNECTGNVNMTAGDTERRTGPAKFRLASLLRGKANNRGAFTRIARLDGFETPEEMVAWFEQTHGLPFDGLLIRWDLDAEGGGR